MHPSFAHLGALLALALPAVASPTAKDYLTSVGKIKSAMLGSIRTSWEQGTAMHALNELDYPQYSVFGSNPFPKNGGILPLDVLQPAVSAVTRQSADGRLSQVVNGDTDGAGLDGASAGCGVWLGALTDPKRSSYFLTAAQAQLNYLLYNVPRTRSGALSHRSANAQYWADGVYMGFPFIAYAGGVTGNQTLLQLAYDNVRLYRDALLLPGPTGPLWGHLYDDESQSWWDQGLWATGNAWAALGAVNVAATIVRTPFAGAMAPQVANLTAWVGEIVNGTFHAVNPDGLIPDYIAGNPATFSDGAATGALASAYFRLAVLAPKQYGPKASPFLHAAAIKMVHTILGGVDEVGLVVPVVDPLNWSQLGVVSTEGQAFALMMFAAWRDWVIFSVSGGH